MTELRKLMTEHNLTTSDVAKIVGRQKCTIEGWLSVGQTRPMPKHMLALLKLKVMGK